MSVQQAQIWSLSLEPTVANEQRGTRPCVVVSTERFNALPIRQAIVVPVTTRDRGFPQHVRVGHDGGLARASWAMCEAVRAVSTQRFGHVIGTADGQTMDAIVDQLVLWLGYRHASP